MMKRRFVLFFLLGMLAIGIAGDADAQFWKRKSSKHNARESNEDDEESSARPSKHHKKERRKKERKKHAEHEEDAPPAPSKHDRKEQRKKERQERKKLKRQRKHKHANTEVAVADQDYDATPAKGKKAIRYPKTTMKDHYRIDVLVPLYIDELAPENSVTPKDKIPDKALPGMAFYKGITIAADSLKNAGFKIDIYIHDVTSANESPEKLAEGKKLDTADLIIGAIQSRDVPVIAEYARKKRINFVSAFSAADGGVKGNPYFTLVQPSLKTHCEWIVDNIAAKYPNEQVSLLYRASVMVDDNAYNYLTTNGGKITFKELMCNHLPTKEELAPVFNLHHPNIVVIPVLDNAYADSLLTELSEDFPSTHFEVYGMPSWNADHSSADMYDNLSINITSPFNFNPTSDAALYVKRACRQDYGEKPSELVYRGYETFFWYANLLKQYGTIFNEHYYDNATAPFTHFDVAPQNDENGKFLFYENKNIYLSTYENGRDKKEQ